MKIEVKQEIVFTPTDNDPENKLTFRRETKGGSTTEFVYADGYDQGASLVNNYEVRNFQTLSFDLYNTNTFTLDLSDHVALADLTLIQIHCLESSNEMAKIPVRFSLSLSTTTPSAATVALGEMSSFCLDNLRDFTVSEIALSSIAIPTGKKAQLIVLLGTKLRNGTV